MSTIAVPSSTTNNSLLRLSVIGGLIIGLLHLIFQVGVVYDLLLKSPFIGSLQYVTSGVMGDTAFAGGLATALLGLIIEFMMTIIIAGIFIFSADRIPLLSRNVIVGSLLYGFGVFIVMNFIVQPLSAAPTLPAPPCGYSSRSFWNTSCSSGCHWDCSSGGMPTLVNSYHIENKQNHTV